MRKNNRVVYRFKQTQLRESPAGCRTLPGIFSSPSSIDDGLFMVRPVCVISLPSLWSFLPDEQ
jgi:hypothetical protein